MGRLPNNEVGISDIIDYRECPQRFGYAMRRHDDMPERFRLFEGEKANPPDRDSYAAAYGSCAHDAIEVVDQTQCTNQEAIDAVWPVYQHWLEVGDADRLDADLDTFRTRTTTGYRLIGTEVEARTPLMVYEGEVIYFRGRIDAIYQHIESPEVFLTRDYKSSRWPKSEEEVHNDLQQWAYNFLIHETTPECERLIQQYDQLRFGLIPTSKTEKQRRQIKAWLIRQVTAILKDDKMAPKQNQWCYTCPLMMDCRVTHMTADYWRNRLAALAPEKKEGRQIVVKLNTEVFGFEEYVQILPKVKTSYKVLERFIKTVEGELKTMPEGERDGYGYGLTKPASLDDFPPDVLRRMREQMGDDFFQVVSVSKSAINAFYGEGSDEAQALIALAEKKQGPPKLKPPRK